MQLYSHYKMRHVPARYKFSSNNFVACPYCTELCAFKDISTHVINAHLIATPQVENDSNTSMESNSPEKIMQSANMSKKRKNSDSSPEILIDEDTIQHKSRKLSNSDAEPNEPQILRVPDLDIAISRKSISGAIIIYEIRKKRTNL